MDRTAGDMKRQGDSRVRVYSLEVRVLVYPTGAGRWLCEDHLGRVRSFPTRALAEMYAEGTVAGWAQLVGEN